MDKTDLKILKIGLRRTFFALATAAVFALSLYSFYLTAIVTGYVAVITFGFAVFCLVASIFGIYCMGVPHKRIAESKGGSL